MQDIILRANDILKPYVANPKDGYPEPSFFLQMSNDVHTDSNLYAVQKLFEGEFQFDVFFESASAKRELSCESLFFFFFLFFLFCFRSLIRRDRSI
jgi:mannosyl-oligosaccharide glucosidase